MVQVKQSTLHNLGGVPKEEIQFLGEFEGQNIPSFEIG